MIGSNPKMTNQEMRKREKESIWYELFWGEW